MNLKEWDTTRIYSMENITLPVNETVILKVCIEDNVDIPEYYIRIHNNNKCTNCFCSNCILDINTENYGRVRYNLNSGFNIKIRSKSSEPYKIKINDIIGYAIVELSYD